MQHRLSILRQRWCDCARLPDALFSEPNKLLGWTLHFSYRVNYLMLGRMPFELCILLTFQACLFGAKLNAWMDVAFVQIGSATAFVCLLV